MLDERRALDGASSALAELEDSFALTKRTLVQEVALASHAKSLRAGRAFVRNALAPHQFDDVAFCDITLAVGEALTNAVEHGAACAPGAVFLKVCIEADEICFYVEDCGAFALRPKNSDGLDRGRGIPLMNLLMDTAKVGRGDRGTCVRLTKKLPVPQ